MARKANNTQAPDERNDNTDEPVTKLATVEDPAKLKKADVDEIAGTDRDPNKPEESANADVADALDKAKKDAKSDDEPAPAYFMGQGGAAGV